MTPGVERERERERKKTYMQNVLIQTVKQKHRKERQRQIDKREVSKETDMI